MIPRIPKKRVVSIRPNLLPNCPKCSGLMCPLPELERARETNAANNLPNPPLLIEDAANIMSETFCCSHALCGKCIQQLQQQQHQQKVHECEYCGAPSLRDEIRSFWFSTEKQIRDQGGSGSGRVYNKQQNFLSFRTRIKDYPACLGCDRCPKHWMHREPDWCFSSISPSEARRNRRVYGYAELVSRGHLSYEELPEDARQAFDELDALGFVADPLPVSEGIQVRRFIHPETLRWLKFSGLVQTMEMMKDEEDSDLLLHGLI